MGLPILFGENMDVYDNLYTNFEELCSDQYLLKFTIRGKPKELHLQPSCDEFEHLLGLQHLPDIKPEIVHTAVKTIKNTPQHECDCLRKIINRSSSPNLKDTKERIALVNQLSNILLHSNGKGLRIYSRETNPRGIASKIEYDYIICYKTENSEEYAYIFLKKIDTGDQIFAESYIIISCFTRKEPYNLQSAGKSFCLYKETKPESLFERS